MKGTRNSLVVVCVLVALVFLAACSEDSLMGPEPQANLAVEKGLSAEEINWIPWKAESREHVLSQEQKLEIQSQIMAAETGEAVRVLERKLFPGCEFEIVKRSKGATVGSWWTLNNQVEVPAEAFPEDLRIVGVFAAYLYGLPGVEFWPDQEFDKNVRVTLSWDCLEFDGDPNDLKVYWLDESTGLWVLVPDPEVNAEQKTVSVYVNHFTRYQWGL